MSNGEKLYPVDLSNAMPGFTELKPDIQKVLEGIAMNTIEVGIQMELIEKDPTNAPIYKGAITGIVAEKLARRIVLATEQGASADQIAASITQGFFLTGVK